MSELSLDIDAMRKAIREKARHNPIVASVQRTATNADMTDYDTMVLLAFTLINCVEDLQTNFKNYMLNSPINPIIMSNIKYSDHE